MAANRACLVIPKRMTGLVSCFISEKYRVSFTLSTGIVVASAVGLLNVVRALLFAFEYLHRNAGNVPRARGAIGTRTVCITLTCAPAIREGARVTRGQRDIKPISSKVTMWVRIHYRALTPPHADNSITSVHIVEFINF